MNLSPLQFRHGKLADEIAGQLQKYELPHNLVGVEITDEITLEHDRVAQQLEQLHKLGTPVSLDGFSTLSLLYGLPLDEIKLAPALIANLESSKVERQLVKAIIDLAHGLGMRTVAKGVERETQFLLLREMGCDQAQGFFLSRPSPLYSLEFWIPGKI
jgi:EAL domain-containing protein (putative c-di-GMP-specific phosphodiesterase class I)